MWRSGPDDQTPAVGVPVVRACSRWRVTEDQHPVEALTADGADEALGEGVGSGSSDRGADDVDTFRLEDIVEAGDELGVTVTDQELDGKDPILQCQGQVSRLLDDPGTGRARR